MTVMSEALMGHITSYNKPIDLSPNAPFTCGVSLRLQDEADRKLWEELKDNEIAISLSSPPAPARAMSDTSHEDYDVEDHLDELMPKLSACIDEVDAMADWLVRHQDCQDSRRLMDTIQKLRMKLLKMQPTVIRIGP